MDFNCTRTAYIRKLKITKSRYVLSSSSQLFAIITTIFSSQTPLRILKEELSGKNPIDNKILSSLVTINISSNSLFNHDPCKFVASWSIQLGDGCLPSRYSPIQLDRWQFTLANVMSRFTIQWRISSRHTGIGINFVDACHWYRSVDGN